MGGKVAKASDAGKELCEALGIDWRLVITLVITYEAGSAVTVTTSEYAERLDSVVGEMRYVKVVENDDLVRIMRNYELVEKGVEEI